MFRQNNRWRIREIFITFEFVADTANDSGGPHHKDIPARRNVVTLVIWQKREQHADWRPDHRDSNHQQHENKRADKKNSAIHEISVHYD
jgi:hypothetical protein